VLTDRAKDRLAPAVGHVHVEEDDVGGTLEDHLDGGRHFIGLAHDVNGVGNLGPDARANEFVVIDQEHARSVGLGHRDRGMTSWTSEPEPTTVLIDASPPSCPMRSRIDRAMPRRSAGIASRSNPTPRSRTKIEIVVGSTSAKIEMLAASTTSPR